MDSAGNLKIPSDENRHLDVPFVFLERKFSSNVQFMIYFMLIFMILINFLIVLHLVQFFYGHTDFGD